MESLWNRYVVVKKSRLFACRFALGLHRNILSLLEKSKLSGKGLSYAFPVNC
jgi:hypothetical protein